MKVSRKEKVYELIESYSQELKHDEYPKFTTNFLSEKLDMQRTNLSSILNQLVNEGKLIKHNGRPVLYQYVGLVGDGKDIFTELVGYDSSLKDAVSIAKAAILYPEGKPNILLTAARGCGVNYFARMVFRFAVKTGAVKANAAMLVFDCKAYRENDDYRKAILYGNKETEGLLEKSRNGMLLIKNIELLPGYERRQILSSKERGILLCCVAPNIKEEILESLKESVDFEIRFPGLRDRTLKERFQLIQKFFQEEAKNLKRNLEVDVSVLYALLLYDTEENTKGLKNDIHTGCANCYARAHQSKNRFIEVLMSDFPNYVRKGIIYYKVQKEALDDLVSGDYKYAFTDSNMLKKQNTQKKEKVKTIYESLDMRKRELKEQKITEEEIDTLVSVKLQSDFQSYFHDLSEKVRSREQLEGLVSGKLIRLVEDFLNNAQNVLQEEFGEKMLGAICLHINGCLVRVDSKQRISNEEIQQMMTTYPAEFELARGFIKMVEHEFRVSMNIDEVIYISLFLIQNKKISEQRVVTLIAMHGSSGASSIADVANVMASENTTFAYNLALDKNMRDAYEELKQTMVNIHQGKGILLIYDMGSIRTMAESIAEETGIDVRYLEVPITLLVIAGSREASENKSLEDIFQYLQNNFKNIEYIRESRIQNISLNELLPEQAVPEEGNEATEIGKAIEVDETAIAETYDYLRKQFDYLDMDTLEKLLSASISQMEYLLDTTFDEDTRIALIVHIVCLIDRMNYRYTPPINFIASEIIQKHQELVFEVRKILKPIEEEFNVYINDGEIAVIISIIRK